MTTIQVQVPATTANIGAGFDCLGAALTLYNQFRFTLAEADAPFFTLEVIGAEVEAKKLEATPDNLLYRAFAALYKKIDQPVPNIQIAIDLNVPLSRGLGSSATAIAGGVVGANALAGSPLSPAEVMHLAIDIEGHPDNVVPALLGGCQLSVKHQQDWLICPWVWHDAIVPVVASPNFELSTEESRKVLPKQYMLAQAVFNASRLGLLSYGLSQNNQGYLQAALDDQLHQPYRKNLIKGYDQVRGAAIAAGAYGMVISGAGPTLLALTSADRAQMVADAMGETWSKFKVDATTRVLAIETQGAIATTLD